MLLRLLAFASLAYPADAGVIQGIVLENASGRPLNRTLLRLSPLAASGGAEAQARTIRSGPSGHFVFPPVAPGSYLLSAVRDGYFPLEFGQRLPVGHGTPIAIADDTNLFAEFRLRHKGAITGRVLDENGVGAPGITVMAYRARLPIRLSGTAVSDDRGVYRIYALDPGKYWIRSRAHSFDNATGWLPTFGPQSLDSPSARIHAVTVENDTPDADVRPEPGRLGSLGGRITCNVPAGTPVSLTLSSETEHRTAESTCAGEFQFEDLAPGTYEVFATLRDGSGAGYTEVLLSGRSGGANIHVAQLTMVDIASNQPVTLSAVRRNFSDAPQPHLIPGKRVALPPGHWLFTAKPPAGSYIVSIVNADASPRRLGFTTPDPDYYNVFLDAGAYARIVVTVSNQAGQITGVVKAEGKPSPAAPVFLWPLAEDARRSLGGTRQTVSDLNGQFHFDSLPPGDYRLLASFDANEVDEELLELSRAPVIHVEPSHVANIELTPWQAP